MHLRDVAVPDDLDALERLFEVVTECDGHRPIGEHKYLDLLHPQPERVRGLVGEHDGHPVSYLAISPTQEEGTWAMELAVHPLHRSRSEVSQLVEAGLARVEEAGGKRVRVWAFQPNFVEVLESLGFEPERELRQLRRPLPAGEDPEFPPGVEVRGFRLGIDEETWLAVNNAAFAGHPENGSWTREILEDRKRQAWFDPDGFRMAWEGSDLVGFCWTKLHDGERGELVTDHPVGEIYVIAVAPHARGRGLGKALVLEGLRYLAEEAGATTGMLYVDVGNTAGLRLYASLGFRLDHVDRSLIREL